MFESTNQSDRKFWSKKILLQVSNFTHLICFYTKRIWNINSSGFYQKKKYHVNPYGPALGVWVLDSIFTRSWSDGAQVHSGCWSSIWLQQKHQTVNGGYSVSKVISFIFWMNNIKLCLNLLVWNQRALFLQISVKYFIRLFAFDFLCKFLVWFNDQNPYQKKNFFSPKTYYNLRCYRSCV